MQPANAVPGTSAAAHPLQPQPVAPFPGHGAGPSQPLLYQACRDGDAAAVKRLPAAGSIAVNAIDPDTRFPPLMLAARHGHDDVALVLMKGPQGADLQLQNSRGDSALSLPPMPLVPAPPRREAASAEASAATAAPAAIPAATGAIARTATLAMNATVAATVPTPVGTTAAVLPATAPVYRSPVKPAAAPAGASSPAAQNATLTTALAATTTATTATITAVTTPPATATAATSAPPAGMTADNRTILRKAAERNDPETLNRIVAAHPGERAAINEPIKFAYQRGPLPAGSYTLLMLAAARGHMPVVQALLALGADANAHGGGGMTALLLAARHGHVETVQALLKAGARVDAQAADGSTAVTLALTQGDKAAVSALLPGVGNPEDSSACLREAASSGYVNTVQLLLKAGAAVNGFEDVNGDNQDIWAYDRIQRALDNSSRESGDSYEAKNQLRFYDDQGKLNPYARTEWANSLALFRAARNGHASTVQALLDAGARLDLGVYSQQLMVDALKGEHTDIVRMLLQARQRASYPKCSEDRVESDMFSLFDAAINYLKGNDPAVIQALLEMPGGKEFACKQPFVLVSAVISGSREKVRALLDAGADPNKPDKHEYPIRLAVSFGRKKDLLEMLIKAGARPELARNRGRYSNAEHKTLLQHAGQYGDIELFRYVMSLGVAACGNKNDINAALGDVCNSPHDTVNKAQVLFDAGADPNWKDGDGRTALHVAALCYSNQGAIELLIKHKAQVDCADFAGQTALMLAAKRPYGDTGTVRLLLQAGANRNLKDSYGKTALQLAMYGQQKDTADLLRSWRPSASS